MSIKVDSDNTLSLTKILALRGEGFATIRRDSAEIALLANHLELLDVALQSNADCRSIDEQQHLVDAARLVAGLLDGSAAAR